MYLTVFKLIIYRISCEYSSFNFKLYIIHFLIYSYLFINETKVDILYWVCSIDYKYYFIKKYFYFYVRCKNLHDSFTFDVINSRWLQWMNKNLNSILNSKFYIDNFLFDVLTLLILLLNFNEHNDNYINLFFYHKLKHDFLCYKIKFLIFFIFNFFLYV